LKSSFAHIAKYVQHESIVFFGTARAFPEPGICYSRTETSDAKILVTAYRCSADRQDLVSIPVVNLNKIFSLHISLFPVVQNQLSIGHGGKASHYSYLSQNAVTINYTLFAKSFISLLTWFSLS